MFSQTTEYALRAMLYLASRDGHPKTTELIAEGTLVPTGYLSKILQMMVRAGLVLSQRGLHGGYSLRKPAEMINLLDIINAVDPLRRIEYCPLGIENHQNELCPLHRRIDEAVRNIEEEFRRTSLALVLKESGDRHPFCESEY